MLDFLIRPFRRNFGIDKEYYRFVDDMFGFIPNNIELYKLALIHKSASQSIGGHHINNERLEFLGDAVIESVTSDYLYIEFPDKNEGFMTQLRAKIVSRQSLNDIAHKIGLDKYVVYNSGGNFTQKHIYGDAFEAMMGAIYLDQGYDFVNRLLINNIYYNHLSIDALTESETDFKSRLIEWCQKNRHTVVFRTRSDAHAPHTAPTFYSTVLIDGIEVGHGVGDSKKVAEQNAACSLSHEISDEECAEFLDKLDRISPAPVAESAKAVEPAVAESIAVAKPKRAGRSKRRTESAETEPATGSAEVATAELVGTADKPRRTRTPRRTKRAGVADVETTTEGREEKGTEPVESADMAESKEKKAMPKRRCSAKPKAAEATMADLSESPETPENQEAATKPKRRRRVAKPKNSGEGVAHEVESDSVDRTDSESISA